MVTMRSSSSEVSSPALHGKIRDVEQIASTDARVPLVQVDIGLLANQVGVTASDTLYFCESKLFRRVSVQAPQDYPGQEISVP